MRINFWIICCLASLLVLSHVAFSQNRAASTHTGSDSSLPDAPTPSVKDTAVALPGAVLKDQVAIWTSPAAIRLHDLRWIVPLVAATGVSLATDHRTMSEVVSHNAQFNQSNVDVSNALTGGLLAVPAAVYGFGLLQKDAHAQQAGVLSAEAVVDGLIVQEGLKLATWRERPFLDNSRGRFFQGSVGTDSSFPSNHSILAWSSAAVIASEYPSRWTQVGVYSMATGVSLTRILGQQHFPTDVLVGSVAGWAIGKYVFHRYRLSYRR
jgi:membrane-associated phospholipid phosphatase